MLNKIVEFLKNNREYTLILGFLLLVVMMYFYDFDRVANTPPTYTVKESTFNLNYVSPPSGESSTLDSYESLWFEFSEPVNISTLDYTIEPTVEFSIVHKDENPNVIKFIPRGAGWIHSTSYTLRITRLNSVAGHSLNEIVTYTYLNTPPDLEGVTFPY